MPTVIFVHGTGVREPAFSTLFRQVATRLRERRPGYRIVPCYWGEVAGARLWRGGASIPDYETARGPEPLADDEDLALWSLLHQDPLWELRTLALAGAGDEELPPNVMLPGDELDDRIRRTEITDDLTAPFSADAVRAARTAVTGDAAYHAALAAASSSLGPTRTAVARAIVAYTVVDQPAMPDAETRDRLVTALTDAFGGTDKAVRDVLLSPVRGLALRIATDRVRRRRGSITDAAYPAAGDVLLYQARGDRIRAAIAERISAVDGPVVLITHSLGGIAAVDLLVSQPSPTVELLVTVGSQAPFLYEIGALWSLPHDAGLPAHMPAWLNVYDERDMLSYLGNGPFGDRVRDVRVDSGQPFPASHSAYWSNRHVWDAIVERLP
ncbi:hypothetical protein [Actinoplanes utahensis]|uniref:Uncharacterized protein n=1 Tax=Actinoplanes utahensis TaxID=1869 RepID=A0A0A6UIY8_ACTUT|nr:hypothetical protein [Actinoplanes utahensis]KHD75391.1 hypothetical protein MB27_23475 [Actinoplanes utahensis]GIF33694.1 hypothetical protein Aut01nite_66800 [Actinoplanes utahensis]